MKELYVIKDNESYRFIDSQNDNLLKHGYYMVPFVITFYDGDDEEDFCFTIVYTTDYRYESYETFTNRIRKEFMNWYSNYVNVPLK